MYHLPHTGCHGCRFPLLLQQRYTDEAFSFRTTQTARTVRRYSHSLQKLYYIYGTVECTCSLLRKGAGQIGSLQFCLHAPYMYVLLLVVSEAHGLVDSILGLLHGELYTSSLASV